MDSNYDKRNHLSQHPRLVETKVSWTIGDELINAVITAALWSEERKPGNWQKMIAALRQGAAKTEEGTVNAFLFRAMVDRLLEEFHGLGGARAE